MKYQNETGALRKVPWPSKAIATVCALAMTLLSVPLGVFHAPETALASSEPVLAKEATWYKGTTEKSAITAISILGSYAADGSEAESWDASAEQDGSVTAYVSADGTTLIIAGDGSGAIKTNASSASAFSNFGNVTGISGLSMLDTSSTVDMTGFFENDEKLASVAGIENWDVGSCADFTSVFRGCEALTSIDISNWDVLTAESIKSISDSCAHPSGLKTPAAKTADTVSASSASNERQVPKEQDASIPDTHDAKANATEAPTLAGEANWYKGTAEKSTIKSIKIVDSYTADGSEAESWDASSKQDGSVMAYILADGTTLTIAGNGSGSIKTDWSTSKAFSGFSSVTEIDNIELFDVSGTSYMENMFYNCKSLTSLNLDGWDVSNVDSFRYTFDRCSSLTSLGPNGLRDWDTSNVTYFFGTFQFCSALANIDVSQWNLSSCKNIDTMFAYCKSLTSIDVSNWDVSKVTNMMSTFNTCTSLQSIDVSQWDTSSAKSMNGLFANCELLTEIDVSHFDTSACVSFGLMFSGCEKLESVDVSRFSTGKVTNFQAMFDSCKSLSTIDTSKWDTASATDMSFLFDDCVKLAVPDMSGWSTSNVTTMQDMFRGCTSMVNLDLTMFDTSSCTKFDGTFENCSNLKTLDISSWDTTSASVMLNMFSKCLRLQQVSLGEKFSFTGNGSASCVLPTPDPAYIPGATGNWQAVADGTVENPMGTVYAPADVPSNVAETYVPEIQKVPILAERATWYKGSAEKSAFTSINIVDSYAASGLESESWDASAEQDGSVTAYISADGSTLTIAGNGYGKIFANEISRLAFRDFSAVTAINGTEILDTQNTTDMEGMFEGDAALLSLNLDNWNVSHVTNLGSVFSGCTSLVSLGSTALRNWDVSSAKTIFTMFSQCSSLEALDVSLWALSSCEYFDFAFRNCSSLTTLDVSGWNTGSAKSMIGTFYGCGSVDSLDVSGWETQNVASMSSLFSGCKTLASLDVSNFETNACTNTSAMFLGCTNLQTIKGINDLDTSNVTDLRNMFAGCKSLTKLDLSNLSSASCTYGIKDMFYNCESLKVLDISGFDTSVCDEMDNAFYGCVRLQQVTLGSGFTFNGSGETRLTNLPTPDPAYIPGAIGKWQAVSTGSIAAPAGTIYDPEDVPSNVAETYVMPMITVDIDVPVKVIMAVDAEGNFVTPTATANKIVNHTAVDAKVVSAVATAAGSFQLEKASTLGSSDTDNIFGGTIAAGSGSASDLTDISTAGDSWSMAKGSVADGSNQISLQLTGAVKNVKGIYLIAPTNVFGITYTFDLSI